MNKHHYISLNETVYSKVLASGLHVFMIPKQGFTKTFVSFSTQLGSINTSLQIDGKTTQLPPGIAHFLEHKLFEQNGEDVSKHFAALGANVNAYTQANRTTYVFSCTDHFTENLELLLEFVQQPQFTDSGIEREKGIITQEMKMYEDDVHSVAYYGLLNNMFESHPVQIDILGTESSIQDINKENLELAHRYFYNPNNMVLVIAGNIDVNHVIQTLEENTTLQKKRTFEIDPITKEEPIVVESYGSTTLDILIPNYLLGIKLKGSSEFPMSQLKQQLMISILFEIILGKSSDAYNQFMQDELINDSFGMNVTIEDSYGYVMIGGETEQPEVLDQALRSFLQDTTNIHITNEEFLRTKKQILGGFVQSLNSLEYITNSFTKYYYQNQSLFDLLDITAEITLEDINDALRCFQEPRRYSTFVVFPK